MMGMHCTKAGNEYYMKAAAGLESWKEEKRCSYQIAEVPGHRSSPSVSAAPAGHGWFINTT
jgi:hypothetical protein